MCSESLKKTCARESGHHLRYTVQRIINQTGPHTGYISENNMEKNPEPLDKESVNIVERLRNCGLTIFSQPLTLCALALKDKLFGLEAVG